MYCRSKARGGEKAGTPAGGAAVLAGLWHASRRALHLSRALLVELSALLQLLVQLPFGRKLEDQVDARLVKEVAVQPQDVVVPVPQSTRRLTAEAKRREPARARGAP